MATSISGNSPFWGMAIYERRGDGTLTGTWKNNALSHDSILSEIARKNDGNADAIIGNYTVSWIEENNAVISGTLTIASILRDTAYSFIWLDAESEERFRGMGMQIGNNQIAVTYWNTRAGLTLTFQ